MTHPLVTQLRFTRGQFLRGLQGITPQEAVRRFEPMNSLSWIIGHLANQENFYWVRLAQGKNLAPQLREMFGFGKPAVTPPLDEMWETWREVGAAADVFLDTLTRERLQTYFELKGKPWGESVGTLLLRNIHHYWFHLGEGMAIRQMLGHKNLPQFVGDMRDGSYRPE